MSGHEHADDAARAATIRIAVPWLVARLLLCLLLGIATTASVIFASAAWLGFEQPGFPGGSATPPGSLRARIAALPAIATKVEVAQWGDHLKPWHIRLTRPGAMRLTWFEKGRVYPSRQGAGMAQSSSAAVSCWSFATSCWQAVGSKTTGELPLPREIEELTQSEPKRAWGVAIEERGWPMKAAKCRIVGTMDANAASPYIIEGGLLLDDLMSVGSATTKGTAVRMSIALQDMAVIPLRPIWPGLLVNSFLYGALWWCALLVPAWALKRFRRAKGACPVCGYDLTGIAAGSPCPECGRVIGSPDHPVNAAA